MELRPASVEDVGAIAALVRGLTEKYITPEFPPEARQRMLGSMSDEATLARLRQGFEHQVAVADDVIVGVVVTRDDHHLYHLYVAETHQGQGVARRLWEYVKAFCIARSDTKEFTVNASNYAVQVYESFGFRRDGPMRNEDGILVNPMILHLEGETS